MKTADVVIAANTIWVVVAAVLVMFMQAGFAFLEAGLTRMKNAAHIAGKNVLVFGVASLVYWLVGFGLAFGTGNGFVGTRGFAPSVDALAKGIEEAIAFVREEFRFLAVYCCRNNDSVRHSIPPCSFCGFADHSLDVDVGQVLALFDRAAHVVDRAGSGFGGGTGFGDRCVAQRLSC